jgi:hypothetical protein
MTAILTTPPRIAQDERDRLAERPSQTRYRVFEGFGIH